MKLNNFLVMGLILFTFFSCKSDDDSTSQSEYPKTVNIKFEVLSETNAGVLTITTTIDNDSQEHLGSFPFSFAATQQEATIGTYIKLTYYNGNGPLEEHEAELRIYVNDEIVSSETFSVSESNNLVFIEYTFQ